MYEEFLERSGLDKDQAIVYEALVKHGTLPAGKVAVFAGLKRGLTYKVLDELVRLGLAEKKEKEDEVAKFEAAHPLRMRDFLEKRERETKDAREVLETVLPKLISDFNLVSGKPGVQFYEGLSGMEQIYNDILLTGKDFLLIRSAYEPVYAKQVVPIVNKFIAKRVKKGLRVTTIAPQDQFANGNERKTPDDELLLTRIPVSLEQYNAPVEIDMYGDKIALMSFGKELTGTIVESPQIADALRQLFRLAEKGARSIQGERRGNAS